MRKLVIILSVFTLIASSCGQSRNKQVSNMKNKIDTTETIKYFKDFGAKKYEPMRLYNEISIDETKNHRTYLKAFYKNGKLMMVEKYLDEELFFRFSYAYDGDKVIDTKIFYGEEKQNNE